MHLNSIYICAYVPVIRAVREGSPAGGVAAPLEDAAIGDAGEGATVAGVEGEALGAGDAFGEADVGGAIRRGCLDLRRRGARWGFADHALRGARRS